MFYFVRCLSGLLHWSSTVVYNVGAVFERLNTELNISKRNQSCM